MSPGVESRGQEVVISGIAPFNLKETLESGQAFRWAGEDVFTGVVRGRVLRVRQDGDELVLMNPVDDEAVHMVIRYFALDMDHASIERRLVEKDAALECAVGFSSGLRLLRQDPWECLISFILSARNAIPLIRRTVEQMARTYGDPIATEDGSGSEGLGAACFFSFPTPGRLASASVLDLVKCGAGFRSQYVKATAERIASGDFSLAGLKDLGYERAKAKLMELRGVGEKVADCVLLFALGFYEAFPIDVWMTRVMRYIYFGGREVPASVIAEFAHRRFGDLAGYAQQYLFHYARKKLAAQLRGLE
ncbi:MAG: DNA-3-methyladenine glycosylase family protein [Bacillota bacterium]